MIDHNHKVIFTHIARCGGTSIENIFVGRDYWTINSSEKHIPAGTSKRLYSSYWDEYYHFTIVRNPFDRVRSLFKYADHYGLGVNSKGEIEMDDYKTFWGHPKVLEVNRFVPFNVIEEGDVDLQEGSVYGNLLSDDVKVFKFEKFPQMLAHLNDKFGLSLRNAPRVESSLGRKPPLSQRSIELIREIHDKDFDKYGYSRDYNN